MNTLLTNLRSSAIISLLIVLPFMILELLTRSNIPGSKLSGAGFVFMWLLPMAFIFILLPIVRQIRAGNQVMAHPILLMLSVVVLVFLAWSWADFMIDQMPCFIGATGC